MKKTAYILLLALGLASCNYLEIEPVGKVIPHKTSEFRALLTEGYFRFPYFDSKTYTGLLSDEAGYFYEGTIWEASVGMALTYNYRWDYGRQMKEYPYRDYYRAIFQAQAVIDDILDADKDSEESNEQIMAEAYALRAYSYFDLVNLYGAPYNPETAATDRTVPLAPEIDIEQKYRPSNVAAVYGQILDDITASERLMEVEKQETNYNYRFSKHALTAFKARVKLYMRDWQEAYDLSASLLPEYELVDLNNPPKADSLPWKAPSKEMIMAWERPFSGAAGDLRNAGFLSEHLLALFDEANDNRRAYLKKVTDYNTSTVGYVPDRSSSDRVSIRIAEMYLIAAEAGSYLPAELENAKMYLLTLKANRLKPEAMDAERTKVEAMNAEQLRAEIADERARELVGEGHRWMDLRRTTRPAIVHKYGDQTVSLVENDSRYTLPFPQSAIDSNPELNN